MGPGTGSTAGLASQTSSTQHPGQSLVQVMRPAASPLHRARLGKDELAVVVNPATGQLLKYVLVLSLVQKTMSCIPLPVGSKDELAPIINTNTQKITSALCAQRQGF